MHADTRPRTQMNPLRSAGVILDRNRDLPWMIRWGHVAAQVLRGGGDILRAYPALICVLLAMLVYPRDAGIASALGSENLGGDVRRELGAWQQFGALGSILVVSAVIWALDPARRRRLLDLALAAGATSLACLVLKMAISRPRPRLEDAVTLPGPFGLYPVQTDGGVQLVSGWSSAAADGAQLWSAPSSHTAAAVALAVFLATLYPRLTAIVAVLAAVVGFARVTFGAHWPSDVLLGAAVGFAVAVPVCRSLAGVSALDWIWRKAVDPSATSAADP